MERADNERLRRLEAQVAHLFDHLGLDVRDVRMPTPEDGLDPDVVELIDKGKKIHAVKLFRDRTGAGLKEAHDAVEAYEQRHRLG